MSERLPGETVYEQQLREMSEFEHETPSVHKGRLMSFTLRRENEGNLRLESSQRGLSMSAIVNEALREHFARNRA